MEETIKRYKILREVGKGGMGVVYKALDPDSQRTVAIKVLPAFMVDRASVERFTREAVAMSKLRHPNLIEIFDSGMEKGQHFYVMEFIDGESLKVRIKHRGPFPVNECMDIVTQIGKALQCIHQEGMIHRDIKPANIMITVEGRIKLMDLGLVQIPGVTRVTAEGSAVGTAEYMSPEQISDEGVDTRSDIYSLGATMYEMLAGQPPFCGENLQAVLMKNKSEDPPPLTSYQPTIKPEVEQIVLKAMAKDLAMRYQKIQEMLDDISQLKAQPKTEEIRPVPAQEKTEVVSLNTVAGPRTPRPEPSVERIGSPKRFPVFAVFLLLMILVAAGIWKRDLLPAPVYAAIEKVIIALPLKGKLVDSAEQEAEQLRKADLHFREGQKYFYQGRLNESIAEHQKAISLHKEYTPFYKGLALAYEKAGRKNEAIATWDELLGVDHSSALANYARQQIQRLQAK